MDWHWSRWCWGQGQMVALICKRGSWLRSWRYPWVEAAAALQLLGESATASGLEQELQKFTASLPFSFFLRVGINPWTCSQGTWPDTAS